MKKNSGFYLVFLILGAFVGGGFASGKEVLIYFSNFGYASIITCMLFGVLFYKLTCMFLTLGHHNQECYSINIYNKQLNIKPFLMLCNLVFVGSMFAGIYDLGSSINQVFGNVLLLVTVIVMAIVLLKGVNGLEKVNFVLMPLLFFVLLLLITLNVGKFNLSLVSNKPIQSFFACIIYLSFNILTLGMFLFEIGKNYTLKQIKKCSAISAIALTSFLTIINTFFVIHINTVKHFTFPLISLANSISSVFGMVVILVVYAGMFTTLISASFTTKQYFSNKLGNIASILFVILVGLVISLIGFENIVGKLYYFIGVVGFLHTCYVISATFLKRKKSNKNCTKKS